MATKKTTKKSYASASSKSRSAKGRRRPAKKGGKGGGVVGPEDPIIVGGGSVPITFGNNFNQMPAGNKHKWVSGNPHAVVTRVAFLSIVNGVTSVVGALPMPGGANAVGICYTGSSCFGLTPRITNQSRRKAKKY